MLTAERAHKILDTLEVAFQRTRAAVEKRRDEGRVGIVAGALSLFGAEHDGELDATVGAVRQMYAHFSTFAQTDVLSRALEEPEKGEQWLEGTRTIERALKQVDGYSAEGTIDDVLAKTAAATGAHIQTTVNTVASSAAGFAWNAIPAWMLVLGVVVAGGFVYLQVRRR